MSAFDMSKPEYAIISASSMLKAARARRVAKTHGQVKTKNEKGVPL